MLASVLKRDLKNLIQRDASPNFQAQNGLLSLRSWWRSVRSLEQSLPDNVRAIDLGIRGFDLAAALLDHYDVVILVDSLSQCEQPGALRVFDSQRDLTIPSLPPGRRPEWRSIDPATALNMAHSLGGNLGRVILVGCEPSRSVGSAVLQIGMTEPVQAAVNDAVCLILSLVAQLNKRAG